MKLVITGATGFIGAEVLRQSLAIDEITAVIALTRRSLPDSVNSPKLKTLIVDDFTSYPEAIKQELAKANACIWAMGTIPRRAKKEVDVDYPLTALNTLAGLFAGTKPEQKFRFVYVSGQMAERDKSKDLWMISLPRKFKGETESNLLRVSSENPDVFEPYIARPALVTTRANWLPFFSIRVDQLAAAMLDMTINGANAELYDNAQLVSLGTQALNARAK